MREYRLTIERPGLHGPEPFLATTDVRTALVQLRKEREDYSTSEPSTRIEIEARTCTEWSREIDLDGALELLEASALEEVEPS